MLLDRKALKQSLVDGTTSSSLTLPDQLPTTPQHGARQGSEPPQLSLPDDSSPSSPAAKDDAHDILASKGRVQKTPQAQTPIASPTTKSFFDAKQLLDPKSFRKVSQTHAAAAKKEIAAASSKHDGDGPPKRDVEEAEGLGAGSLIERMHNVSQRDEHLHKKRKTAETEPDDKDVKASFKGGGRGGDLGQYIKEERKKGLENNGVNGPIDLTAAGKLRSPYSPCSPWNVCMGARSVESNVNLTAL